MKTFIIMFTALRGLPRTRETRHDAKIFNAQSLEEAEEEMEKYLKKHWLPHGWSWSISGKEIRKKRLELLLKGKSRRIF